MKIKVIEKKEALKLRENGKSLNEISRLLSISKSTASLWCRGKKLSKARIRELIIQGGGGKLGALANKLKREKEIIEIKKKAALKIDKFKKSDLRRLKDIGSMLYWAEGCKRGSVDFTNSDPKMIRIIMLWLRKIWKVPESKFTVGIHYHKGQNENEIKKYWSKITEIPLRQFKKSYLKKEGTGFKKNILYKGTCKIRVCNRNLLHSIFAWIEQFYIE